jgi:tetratricopeptide (TPR) repeat protein
MRRSSIVLVLLLLAHGRPAHAQQIDPSKPPPPPPPEAPAAPPESAEPAESSEPAFDPLHAQRSLEIGTFYLKKGNYDAAIDRFEDAIHLQPGLAKPWRLMGEAYDKKHANTKALECFKRYLEILPNAEDAAKVKSRIAALEEKAGQQASKSQAR